MKKIFFSAIAATIMFSCNQPMKQQQATSPAVDSSAMKAAADMKALYEKNLATLKTGIAAFENKNIDAWAATVADNAVWHSPAYGDMDSSKAHWKATLTGYLANWDSLKLLNPVFLPGIDQKTMQPDGSVRYYGQWAGLYKGKKKTLISFYGTYDFDKDGKVSQGADFFDVGGLMKAVGAK